MENGLLIYMMVICIYEDQTIVMEDARQWNEANRAISIGKQHTDCLTNTYDFQTPPLEQPILRLHTSLCYNCRSPTN